MVNVVYSYIKLTYFEVSKILCKHSVDVFFHVFFAFLCFINLQASIQVLSLEDVKLSQARCHGGHVGSMRTQGR